MNKLKGFAKGVFVVLVFAIMMVLGGASAVYYENFEKNLSEENSKLAQFLSGNSSNNAEQKVLEPNFTCLFMGRNAHLTDFMMLGQYNPNTREVSLMSIPRDTYVGNASVDGKINSIYMYKYQDKVVKKVEEITGVDIEHYVIFDAKILRNIVNEIGGVTVDVPINMNYDDPEQNLYIHLKKGVQKLTGAQAEQFVRFRKNNDGTGYPNGDIGRIAAQQQFIKAMAAELLKTENLGKLSNLVKIVLDGTKTDITMDVISEYLDDVVTFKTDRIRMETMPGEGRYDKGPDGYTRSFYFHDEEATDLLVQDLFYSKTENKEVSGDIEQIEGTKEVVSSNLQVEDDRIRIEVLNANAKTSRLNDLVEKLNDNDCNVVKIGNFPTNKVESSRIIIHGSYDEKELEKVRDLTGIAMAETSAEKSTVKFSVIIGSQY